MKKKIERAGLLGVSLLALGAMTAPAMAQDEANTTAENQDEEIVVVGSRIRRDNFNAPSPVQIITAEESTRAGFASAAEVLQSSNVASSGAQVNNLYGGFVVDGGGGVNTLGLRGFGPTSTLVLLNGRRLTPAGVRGSVGAADLNTIPSSLVQRIEILKDGASSVYGSDAVAGVVNIITEDHPEGFTIEGQRNFTEGGGGEQNRISLSGGGRIGEHLSLVGSLEYYEREAQTLGQRAWSACPGDGVRDPDTGESLDDVDPLTGQPKCWSIGFANSRGVTVNTIATASRPGVGGPGAPATGNFTRWRVNPYNVDGVLLGSRLDGFEGVNGGGTTGYANRDLFDPRMLDADFITPTRNINAFASGIYDLPGNNELYGEFLFSRRESSSHTFVQLSLDYPNNALLPAELRLGGPALGSTIPNPPPQNVILPAPFDTQVRAFIGGGLNNLQEEVNYTRIVAGVRGDLDFWQGWRYDFNVYHGRNDSEESSNNFLVDRLFNSVVISPAVGGEPANLVRNINGTDYVCTITLTNPNYGCIPAPALNAQTVAGQLPGDYLNWVRQTITETNEYTETAFSFVVDGPLFTLPAGDLQVVLGVEHRAQEILDTPDINARNRNVAQFTAGDITRGSDSVTEVFAEAEIPFLRDAPFARSLAADVSARYTNYESYGSDSTYKVGVTWEPISDLLFRGSIGTSYRAPALFEQFLGPVTGFLASNGDPCDAYGDRDPSDRVYINCNAEIGDPSFQQNNGVTVLSGGGAANHLFAETSDNSTIGFSWRPLRDVDGWGDLSIAADRFTIELRDAVQQPGTDNILDGCYESPNPANEPLCQLVERDASNRLLVNNNYTNISSQVAEGWDYGLRYAHSLAGGEVVFDLNLTQYTDQTYQFLPTDAPSNTNGRIDFPQMSGNAALNFSRGPWNIHYDVTWIDDMSDYAVQEEDPDTSFFDLQTPDYFLQNASIQYGVDAWRVTLGVRNLTDEQPPRVSSMDNLINGAGQTPIFSGFDYIGRQFFVNVSTHF